MPHRRSKEKKSLRKRLWEMRRELSHLPKVYDSELRELVSTSYSWNFDAGHVLFGPRNYEDPFLRNMKEMEAIVEEEDKYLKRSKPK